MRIFETFETFETPQDSSRLFETFRPPSALRQILPDDFELESDAPDEVLHEVGSQTQTFDPEAQIVFDQMDQ